MGLLESGQTTPKAGAGIGPMLAVQAAQSGIDMLGSALQRKWNQKDYQQQRADALADWNRQNEYNSPQQQMQRLKEAGLNPNLVYGQGATAMSSQAVRSSNLAPSKLDLKVNPLDSMLQYQNVKQTQIQSDNLRKQGELLDKEKQLKDAQTLALNKRTDSVIFDLDRRKYLDENGYLGFQLDTASAKLHNIEVNTRFKMDENVRREVFNTNNLKYIVAKIGQANAQTSMIPYQKELIKANTSKALQDLEFGKYKEEDRRKMAYLLQKNENWKTVISSKNASMLDVQRAIAEIKKEANANGISPEFTENILKAVIPVITKQ